MTPSCSSISYFPSAQTRNSRNGPTATFPEDSIPAHAGKTPGMDTTSHCVSAHPRSRGENALQPEGPTLRSGSSPLTRGKLGLAVVAVGALGLIPAHAGKTRRRSPRALGRAAHPRSRGENDPSRRQRLQPHGSSPLTRGKLRGDELVGILSRPIPAHAGKTPAPCGRTRSGPAHPRSRGENDVSTGKQRRYVGSSPLTRGKRDLPLSESLAEGLIPAHAGKTSGRPSPTGAAAAHPRSRGENANSGRPAVSFAGSSPLTRGKRADDALRLSNPGLIPAHAGKTLRSGSLIGRTTAHPRSRGENHWMPHPIDPSRGSSPLTRGKHFPFTLDDGTRRLIPAHAGKTAPLNLPWGPTGAHPRSRGENTPDV